jgi:hypothetical protein
LELCGDILWHGGGDSAAATNSGALMATSKKRNPLAMREATVPTAKSAKRAPSPSPTESPTPVVPVTARPAKAPLDIRRWHEILALASIMFEDATDSNGQLWLAVEDGPDAPIAASTPPRERQEVEESLGEILWRASDFFGEIRTEEIRRFHAGPSAPSRLSGSRR